MRIFRRRCGEYIHDLKFPSLRCLLDRGHEGAHRDKSGDVWEGSKR